MNHINGTLDYLCAAALLDELTDGHDLNAAEVQTLVELEVALISYENECVQLQAFNAAVSCNTTPVQLLNDLIDTPMLSAFDLPEIGDAYAPFTVSLRVSVLLTARWHPRWPSALAWIPDRS